MPLHTAYPVTEGLIAVGVLLVGSLLVYKERIRPIAWAGACLVLAGIVLFSLSRGPRSLRGERPRLFLDG